MWYSETFILENNITWLKEIQKENNLVLTFTFSYALILLYLHNI